VLPVLQAEEVLLKVNELPPVDLDAKRETFLRTSVLWQAGQITSSTALELRTSSSKGLPHRLQTNSKIGIFTPCEIIT
jgi:hypothetical protein